MALKILAYGDAGAPTGFEKVIRNILTHLAKQDDIEVVQYGLGYRGNPEMPYDYPVYPAEHQGDFFGMAGLDYAAKKHQADVLFVLQDLWNVTSYMAHKPMELPAVCYFPVDTPNIKWSYALSLGAITCPVTYTQFAAQEVAAGVRDVVDILMEGAGREGVATDADRTYIALPNPPHPKLHLRLDRLGRFQNTENISVVNHGLDHAMFYPMDKAEVRKEFGLPEDVFIVGCIGTNQFRKRQDTAMRIFGQFAKDKPNARLLVYCTGSDERGWDLEQLARYFGILDKVYFVHQQIDRALTDDEMRQLYNTCDVMLNTSGGEGWGLTSAESAACGVPQIVPDWAATREIWKDHGMLIRVKDWRFEPRFLNTAHAILDVRDAALSLQVLWDDPNLRYTYSQKALERAQQHPSWDDVGRQFHRLCYRAFKDGPPIPTSLDALLAARTGSVKSELANRYI